MKLPRTRSEVAYARAQGRILHEMRRERGVTRSHIAKAAEISEQTLFRLEMGDSTANAFHLAKLARAFGVDVVRLCPPPEMALPAEPETIFSRPPAHYETVGRMLALATHSASTGVYA